MILLSMVQVFNVEMQAPTHVVTIVVQVHAPQKSRKLLSLNFWPREMNHVTQRIPLFIMEILAEGIHPQVLAATIAVLIHAPQMCR